MRGSIEAVVQRAVPRVGPSEDGDQRATGSELVLVPTNRADVARFVPGLRFTGTVDTGTGPATSRRSSMSTDCGHARAGPRHRPAPAPDRPPGGGGRRSSRCGRLVACVAAGRRRRGYAGVAAVAVRGEAAGRRVWSDGLRRFRRRPLPSGAEWLFDTGTSYPGGAPQWGTGEIQTYTDDPANVGLDGDGHLGSPPPGTPRAPGARRAWRPAAPTSSPARRDAEGRGAASRCRTAGPGYWAAFWMLGDAVPRQLHELAGGRRDRHHGVQGPAPADGLRHVPLRRRTRRALQREQRPRRPVHLAGRTPLPADFHTYGIQWDRSTSTEEIRWYLDGAAVPHGAGDRRRRRRPGPRPRTTASSSCSTSRSAAPSAGRPRGHTPGRIDARRRHHGLAPLSGRNRMGAADALSEVLDELDEDARADAGRLRLRRGRARAAAGAGPDRRAVAGRATSSGPGRAARPRGRHPLPRAGRDSRVRRRPRRRADGAEVRCGRVRGAQRRHGDPLRRRREGRRGGGRRPQLPRAEAGARRPTLSRAVGVDVPTAVMTSFATDAADPGVPRRPRRPGSRCTSRSTCRCGCSRTASCSGPTTARVAVRAGARRLPPRVPGVRDAASCWPRAASGT